MFHRRRLWLSLLIAVSSVALVAGARLLIERADPNYRSPFLLFAMAVLLSGIAGGFIPAMVATVLSMVTIDWLFLGPGESFDFSDRTLLIRHILFAVQGVAIAVLAELYHRNLEIARKAREELEQRVEQRTAQLASANQQLMDEVHERTQAEQSLEMDRNFLTALLESLQEGIIACDVNGRISRYNTAAARMCHGQATSDSPDAWWEHLRLIDSQTDSRLEGNNWPLARVLREGQYDAHEITLITPDDAHRVVSISGRTIQGDDGRVLGGVISLHDITEVVETRRRLNDVIEELQRSNRELQDFASVASHDLQEPLRKIQAFGDRLKVTQGDRLTDQGQDYLARMHNAAGRMQVLINDLLAFSRVTTRAQPFEKVDLAQIVHDVLDDLEERITSSGGRVEVGQLPDLHADPLQLRQLLQNLISNALKFHKPNVPPLVRISAEIRSNENDEQLIELRIQDNGIGFDEKYLDRIFNIFQRLHGRGEYEGTGVGLAVCRKIVTRHGGELTAHSRSGEGATFVVTLPRYQREVEPIHAG